MTAALSAHQQLGWPDWKGGRLDPDSWDTGTLLGPYGAAAEMPSYSDMPSETHLGKEKTDECCHFSSVLHSWKSGEISKHI